MHSIIKLLTLNIKTMKREDLKLGEYYVYDKRQVLIFKGIKVNTKVLDLETKSFTTQNYSYNLDDIRHATPEEKHWLDVCINKDTFVPREIAMVTFKSKEIDFIYGDKHLWRYATTQEIMEYDIQDRPVDVSRIGMAKLPTYEPEPVGYVIPSNAKKWAVKRTEANYVILNDWANSKDDGAYGHSSAGGWIHSINYGFGGHTGHGHFYADDTKHPDHTEITTDQFRREYMNDKPKVTNEIPKYVKLISYASKYINHIFSTNDPPPKEFCSNWDTILLDNKRLEDGSFIPATIGEYEAFINNAKPQSTMANKSIYANKSIQEMLVICQNMFPIGSKVKFKNDGVYTVEKPFIIQHNQFVSYENFPIVYDDHTKDMRAQLVSTPDNHQVVQIKGEVKWSTVKQLEPEKVSLKNKSLGEICDLCNQMFPIGSVVDFSEDGSDLYTIKEKLYIGSSSYISYNGLPIVYRWNEDTLRCKLVSAPVKTIEDLPKKATLSDVSALVKHQEPVIVQSKKTKRSKLIIINK